ncbi:MAG: OsmC family protein [Archangium sp.]|nr:OsmC family protein [Archangium sp.]
MAGATRLEITIPGGRRVDARVRSHVVHTDQPLDNGGEDTAPSPFELFLASIGTCAGIFVQGFCAKRGIPTDEIRIIEHAQFGADGVLSGVELELQLPPSFPERYRGAVQTVVEQCSVKKAIAAQPTFTVRTSGSALQPTPHTPATTGADHQAR